MSEGLEGVVRLAALVYAGKDWHSLSVHEQLLVEKLAEVGSIIPRTPANGFVGEVSHYRVKHILPNGFPPVYAIGMFGMITPKASLAEVFDAYSTTGIEALRLEIRKYLEYTWGRNTSEAADYRKWPGWHGCTLLQIETVVERCD